MDRPSNPISWVFNGIAGVFTAMQTEETLRIVSLILTIIATLVSVSVSIYGLIKKAKEDGKIDSNEIEEIASEVKKGVDQITDEVKKYSEEREDKNNGESKK